MPRLEREKETVTAMIRICCRDLHKGGELLCGDCAALLDYAVTRLDRCSFGPDKPKCADCPIHCYTPAMRSGIREVMKYAGPRMALRHPVLALGHAVDGLRHCPVKGRKPKGELCEQRR